MWLPSALQGAANRLTNNVQSHLEFQVFQQFQQFQELATHLKRVSRDDKSCQAFQEFQEHVSRVLLKLLHARRPVGCHTSFQNCFISSVSTVSSVWRVSTVSRVSNTFQDSFKRQQGLPSVLRASRACFKSDQNMTELLCLPHLAEQCFVMQHKTARWLKEMTVTHKFKNSACFESFVCSAKSSQLSCFTAGSKWRASKISS